MVLRDVDSLWRISVRAPRAALAVCFGVVLILLPGIFRLQLATDGLALVPEDSAAAAIDREAREHFGIDDQVIVVLRSHAPEGVLNAESLARLAQLTRALSRQDAIDEEHLQSLSNEPSDRVRPGTFEFRTWLDPLPTSEADLVRLRKDLDDAGVYRGTLLSLDTPPTMTACLVNVPRNLEREAFLERLHAALDEVDVDPDELHLVGAPIAESSLGTHILEDLARLIPLSMLCMLAVFWLAFRRPMAALLPLLEVGACLAITLGLMGWVGAPFYLTVGILPVALTAIGVADELHVFFRFLQEREGTAKERVERTMSEMAKPITQTSLTTAVGFLSFCLSPLAPVRTFGIFMAVGVLVCLLWSLVAVPALLVSLPERAWHASGSSHRWNRVPAFFLQPSKRKALATLLGVLLCTLGVSRLEVQDSWLGGFSASSEFAQSTRLVDENFGGAHMLRIQVGEPVPKYEGTIPSSAIQGDLVRITPRAIEPLETYRGRRLGLSLELSGGRTQLIESRVRSAREEQGELVLEVERERRSLADRLPRSAKEFPYLLDGAGRLLSSEVLRAVGELESLLAAQDENGVGRVLGPHEHLSAMNFMLRQRLPGSHEVPSNPQALQAVLHHYVDVRGQQRLEEILGPDSSSGLITVFLRESNFRATRAVMDRVREFEAERLEPLGLSVSFAGDVAVSQSMIGGIVGTQVRSLLGSLIGVWIVASLLLRSLRLGTLSALPALCAVGAILGLMGWTGVPLGVATSMFAATVLGIGVDYAIHWIHRAQRSSPVRDWKQTLLETAPIVLLDVLAIGLAFGLLIASQVPSNARLGLLTGLSLIVCACVTLVVLPAWGGPRNEVSRISGSLDEI